MHLRPNDGAASLFKMLIPTCRGCAFSSARALSSNVIYIFEMACGIEPGGISCFQLALINYI